MDKNSFDLITFGEIMLRLSPPRHARIVDGDIFEKRAGGAELNVASGVALLSRCRKSRHGFKVPKLPEVEGVPMNNVVLELSPHNVVEGLLTLK